jgi:hypothetical protein
MIWTGLAVLMLDEEHPSRQQGYRGAFAAFACESDSLASAVAGLTAEFKANALELVGVEEMLPPYLRERELTVYEDELVAALPDYSVQFKNVHFHKGES